MTLKTTPKPISWADSLPKPNLKKVLEAYLKLRDWEAYLELRDRSNPNNSTA
jgi:hypothetical protein